MIAITVPLLVMFLLTSQYIDAYPSASVIGTETHQPINLRLKRAYSVLQHHDLINNLNDDIPFNLEDNLPYVYPTLQRANRKRLIDF